LCDIAKPQPRLDPHFPGILVSTLLTLVVIPVLYYALFRRRMESRANAH